MGRFITLRSCGRNFRRALTLALSRRERGREFVEMGLDGAAIPIPR
jgi:hypothetical protein